MYFLFEPDQTDIEYQEIIQYGKGGDTHTDYSKETQEKRKITV